MKGLFRKEPSVSFDPDTQIPVIRASICTGERVAGFKSKADGHFTDILTVKTPADEAKFHKLCGGAEIKTEY